MIQFKVIWRKFVQESLKDLPVSAAENVTEAERPIDRGLQCIKD